jgi:hypothetical protein
MLHINLLNGHGRENKKYSKDQCHDKTGKEKDQTIFQDSFSPTLFIKISHRFVPEKQGS